MSGISDIRSYRVWFTVTVSHPYFVKTGLPVVLAPSQETECFFRRNSLLFKQRDRNVWCVYSEGKEVEPVEELCFEVKGLSDLLYYVSGEPGLLTGCSGEIRTGCIPGIWKELHILSPVEGGCAEWGIPVRKRYWECLVFIRQPQLPKEWVIREKRGAIEFEPPERMEWGDDSTVFRSCSTSMILLQAAYPYTLQLVERRNGRERVLLESLGCPEPQYLSLQRPDCLTLCVYL